MLKSAAFLILLDIIASVTAITLAANNRPLLALIVLGVGLIDGVIVYGLFSVLKSAWRHFFGKTTEEEELCTYNGFPTTN